MNYPEIIIKDAWLLRDNASRHLHELWAKDGEKLADSEDMTHIVDAYKEAWEPYEQQILKGMGDIFGLEFKHNIIDVYIAPWFHGFSDPLVIGVTYDPDEFIDALTHELLHRLLTMNTIYNIDTSTRKLGWKKLFGAKHSATTLVHIPVHAGLKAVFLDVLNEPGRLERDIERCKQIGKGYDAAWDYVEANDYRDINTKIKESYKNIE